MRTLACLLFCLLICGACLVSCNPSSAPTQDTTPQNTAPQDTTPAQTTSYDYIPQTLEQMQSEYPEYYIFSLDAYEHVRFCPNGTPDPKVPDFVPETATADGVTFVAVQEQVSADFEKIEFRLSKSDKDESLMYYSAYPRLERLENGEWKRLYYLPYPIVTGYEWPASGISGSVTLEISRDCLISRLGSGTYRAIAFVGYNCTPLYAEFEIK